MAKKKKHYTLDDIFAEDGNTLRKDAPVSNEFVRACADGNITKVRRMLAKGADVNQVDMGLPTEDGCIMSDMRMPNSRGASGIHMAAITSNLDMLKLLREAGADPMKPTIFGDTTALDLALAASFLEGVKYLVDECKYPLPQNPDGTIAASALFTVVRGEDRCTLDMVKYLVEKKGIDACSMGKCPTCPPDKVPELAIVTATMRKVAAEVFGYFLDRLPTPNIPLDPTPAYQVEVNPGAETDVKEIMGKAQTEKFSLAGFFADRHGNNSTLLNKVVSNLDEVKTEMLLNRGADPGYKGNGTRNAFDVLESTSTSFITHDEAKRARIHEMLSNAALRRALQSPGQS